MTDKITGSCLCGACAYESDAPSAIGHCHCRTCQKSHSAAFATTGRAPKSAFRWTKGADFVAAYASSPGKTRHFCPKCGTHMMAQWDSEDQVILRIASLDKPLDVKPGVHIWTSQKAWFFDFDDGLKHLPEGRPTTK